MKTKLWMMSALLALVAAAALQSCNDDDDNRNLAYPNALVTLKTNASGTFFLQLDDSTTVIPTNMKASPYGKKEVRALANINMDAKEPKDHVKSGYVNWLDSILTKNMAPNLGDKNDATYGNDPVELVKDWTTLVEDGDRRVVRDGLVAFRLIGLPDTGGKEEELTVKWKSFSGEKSAKFKYRTRK